MAESSDINVLVIYCGPISTAFQMVNHEKKTMSKTIEVDGCWRLKLNMSLAEGIDDLKEKCNETDAYLIFYDTTRPKTVSIYDTFIKDIIHQKHKEVRVIGLEHPSASFRRRSTRSQPISRQWGKYHSTVINKKDGEKRMRSIYSEIAAKFVEHRTAKLWPMKICTIL